MFKSKSIAMFLTIVLMLSTGSAIVPATENNVNTESELVEVKTNKIGDAANSEISIDPELRDNIIIMINEKNYEVNEDNELVSTEREMAVSYATYSKKFKIKNGKLGAFDRYVPKGRSVVTDCYGASEYRRLTVFDRSNGKVAGKVYDNVYSIGFAFKAKKSSNYAFQIQNCCASTKTWTLRAIF